MPVVSNTAALQMLSEQKRTEWGINERRLPPTLGRISRLMAEETFPICNVGPWAHQLSRISLTYYLPAYDKAKDHQKKGFVAGEPMPIIRREAKILDENEFTYFEDDGRAVACDLIGKGPGMPKENNLEQYGVFIPAASEPTAQEVLAAEQRLFEYRQELIREARDAYDLGPKERQMVIGPRHIWAGHEAGLDEAWLHHQHAQEKVKCARCGSFNPEGVAQCAKCAEIIDYELHFKLEAIKAQKLAEFEKRSKKGG